MKKNLNKNLIKSLKKRLGRLSSKPSLEFKDKTVYSRKVKHKKNSK
jgi:hypothetical protein